MKEEMPRLKIWNFGKCKMLDQKRRDRDFRISAPELLDYRTNPELESADMWSLGAMLYQATTGQLPFDGGSPEEIARKIREGEFSLGRNVLMPVYFRDLLENVLMRDPSRRLTFPQISMHPWIAGREVELASATEFLNFELFKAVAFGTKDSDLKRIVSLSRAINIDEKSLEDLKKAFTYLDGERIGGITAIQLESSFLGMAFSQEDAKEFGRRIVEEFDYNRDGIISFEDFVALVFRAKLSLSPEFVQLTYAEITKNGSIPLNANTIINHLGPNKEAIEKRLRSRTLERAIKKVDIDKDGKLTFEEYAHAMKNWNPVRKSLNDRSRRGSDVDISEVEEEENLVQ